MESNDDESKLKEQIDKLYQSTKQTAEYKILLNALSTLVETIKTTATIKKAFEPCTSLLKERLQKNAKRMLLFKEDSRAKIETELTTLRKAFVYLGLFESTVVNMLDVILMVFIVNGHDFFIYRTKKYAENLKDLDDAFLSEKLDFLNHHNLPIFSQMLNRDLRNKVAHLDFEIEENGKISVGKQKYDLEDEITKLMAFVLLVYKVLEDCGVPQILNELSQ